MVLAEELGVVFAEEVGVVLAPRETLVKVFCTFLLVAAGTFWKVKIEVYSGSFDKGPSEIGTTSLQRTLVAAPC